MIAVASSTSPLQLREIPAVDRLAEIVALEFIAGVFAQKVELLLGFDPFGDDR